MTMPYIVHHNSSYFQVETDSTIKEKLEFAEILSCNYQWPVRSSGNKLQVFYTPNSRFAQLNIQFRLVEPSLCASPYISISYTWLPNNQKHHYDALLALSWPQKSSNMRFMLQTARSFRLFSFMFWLNHQLGSVSRCFNWVQLAEHVQPVWLGENHLTFSLARNQSWSSQGFRSPLWMPSSLSSRGGNDETKIRTACYLFGGVSGRS